MAMPRKEMKSLQRGPTLLLLLLLLVSSTLVTVHAEQVLPPPPTLSGSHFRFTVVHLEGGWVEIEDLEDYDESDNNPSKRFNITGYSIDMIREVAKRANFTYELVPPSGFGSLCKHPEGGAIEPYGKAYRGQFLCGQNDVQEDYSLMNQSEFSSDFYHSLYYITPERLLLNRFSVPFIPPAVGNFQLYGISIHVTDMEDYVAQQKARKVGKVCLHDSTADTLFAISAFPEMEYELTYDGFAPEQIHAHLQSGKCDTFFGAWPQATQNVMLMQQRGICSARGMPIGLVGAPLDYGYGHFALGIKKELDISVDHAINYWMTYLMSCAFGDEAEGNCPWNFASGYKTLGGGTGAECGYVAFPPKAKTYSVSAIVGITVAVIAFLATIALCGYLLYDHQKRQHRIRVRFVQQVARYIEIGNSPEDITATKLSAIFNYISGDDSAKFTEKDFLTFMMDIHLPFLSDKDLKVLWMELDSLTNNDLVSPLEFVLFLRTCHKEFAMVKLQLKEMNKRERLKFTVRRLTSIELEGAEAVRKRECEMNKLGRGYQTLGLLGNTLPTRRGSGSSRSGGINNSSRSARTSSESSGKNSIAFSPAMKKRSSLLSRASRRNSKSPVRNRKTFIVEDPKPESSTAVGLMNAIKDISGFNFSPPVNKEEAAPEDVASNNGDKNSVVHSIREEEEVDEQFLEAVKRISNVEDARDIMKDMESTMGFLKDMDEKELDDESSDIIRQTD